VNSQVTVTTVTITVTTVTVTLLSLLCHHREMDRVNSVVKWLNNKKMSSTKELPVG
jgi:hypothetical protein